MKKRILFLVNGLGLGNSTRCHAVIQELLLKEVEVKVITSENGLWYFQKTDDVSKICESRSFHYASTKGKIDVFGTIRSTLNHLKTLRENAKRVGEAIRSFRPNAVVTDSDYTFLPVKKAGLPLIALNNADGVVELYGKFTDHPASIRAQFHVVERMDALFHRVFPDCVISPVLDHKMLVDSGRNIRRVGPIVRRNFGSFPLKSKPKRAVVMLSGSVFGSPVYFSRSSHPVHIDVIGRDPAHNQPQRDHIVFHGKITSTQSLLAETDLAVINGGFSAVSELFWLRKPLVIVPVPNHAEQWINARTIEHLGVGMISSEENLENSLMDALERIDSFREAYDKLPIPENGAQQAAKIILEMT
jgi:UDP:flavonoid glycosyltransferase YjiC (YdhE family)